MTDYELTVRIELDPTTPKDEEEFADILILPEGIPDTDLDLDNPHVLAFMEELMDFGTVTDISTVIKPVGSNPFVDIKLHVEESTIHEILTGGLADNITASGIDEITVLGIKTVPDTLIGFASNEPVATTIVAPVRVKLTVS